jgi:hypothetical protein
MSPYLLTPTEAWILCTLLHLPVQPGSALAAWLSAGKITPSPNQTDESMSGLRSKGYYDPAKPEQPFTTEFLSTLTLASVNAAEITTVIRRRGQANLTRFAQVGEGLVQFGMDEKHLTLHPVEKIEALAETFLPYWFTVRQDERLRAELPLGAFLFFKQACLQADMAYIDSGFRTKVFRKNRLLERFVVDQGWVDIFHAEEVRGMLAIGEMPLEDYYNQLIARGYLEECATDSLQIGPEGRPLAAALADADLCSLTLSLQTWEGGFPLTGVFLYGAGRLFLVDVKAGLLLFRQLASLGEGEAWVRNLLAKGNRACFASYTIPKSSAGLTALPQSVPATEQAAKLSTTPLAPPVGEETLRKPRPLQLWVDSGPLRERSFPLNEGLSIGRGPENDLQLSDLLVSRRHAAIVPSGEGYLVTDLGSGNGTFVNRNRIQAPTRLKPGDVVVVGDTQLHVAGAAAPEGEPTQLRTAPAQTSQTNPTSQPAPASGVCPHCGFPLQSTSKFCGRCGGKI